MHIVKVISYKNAWNLVSRNNESIISETLEGASKLASMISEAEANNSRLSIRSSWEEILQNKGWTGSDDLYDANGVQLFLGRLGPIKNGITSTTSFGLANSLSKWLFQDSVIAIKQGIVKTPTMILPMQEFSRRGILRPHIRETFESTLRALAPLSPLSHQHPFLIIGYSDQNSGSIEVIELNSASPDEPSSVVDRSIEFPPEYHQAGLGILNYFGTYLREQYPEENASVKIEQHGLKVRLVIETQDGRSEIIEKALHEYELIITGAKPPENFTQNGALIYELRSELRIAQLRLESKQDLINLQNNRIDQLLCIIGSGLSRQNQVSIDFKPNIALTNDVEIKINHNISSTLGSITELLEALPQPNEAHIPLQDLQASLEKIESSNDPDLVRKSAAMSKFRRTIDQILDKGSALNSAIKKADEGWEIFSDIAKKYNSLAEWCGLPVVPSPLLKQS
jgi:hypothetical protein